MKLKFLNLLDLYIKKKIFCRKIDTNKNNKMIEYEKYWVQHRRRTNLLTNMDWKCNTCTRKINKFYKWVRKIIFFKLSWFFSLKNFYLWTLLFLKIIVLELNTKTHVDFKSKKIRQYFFIVHRILKKKTTLIGKGMLRIWKKIFKCWTWIWICLTVKRKKNLRLYFTTQ